MAIFVGNCSWTDPTLIACGRFYPATATSRRGPPALLRHALPHRRGRLHLLRPPEERTARAWVERTPPGFVFDVKAFALLTGHGAPPERLPPALRAEVGPRERGRSANVYLKDLSAAGAGALWQLHRTALAPLHEAGKLGAVLFQFPPWFTIGRSATRAPGPAARGAARLPGGGRVPRRGLAARHRHGRRDPRLPAGPGPRLRVRRRAPGVPLQHAAGGGRHRRPGDRALPRPQRREVGGPHQRRVGALQLPLRGGRARGVGAPYRAAGGPRRRRCTSCSTTTTRISACATPAT